MADDKSKRGSPDNKRLNKSEPYEVAYARRKAAGKTGAAAKKAGSGSATAKKASGGRSPAAKKGSGGPATAKKAPIRVPDEM